MDINNILISLVFSDLIGKFIAVVGNFHVFKKIAWQDHVPNKTGSIREYLNGIAPDMRPFSIGQLIDYNPDQCDFSKTYGSLEGSIALDCTEGFSTDWKIGGSLKDRNKEYGTVIRSGRRA